MSVVSSPTEPMHAPLHILGKTFSTFVRSVMLICEELDLPYVVSPELDGHTIKFGDEHHVQQHPFGKVPVLMLEDRNITETSTILRFIDNKYGQRRFQAEDLADNALIDQWCAYASIYLDSAIVRNVLLEFVFPKGENGEVRQDVVAKNLPALRYALNTINTQLENQDFICGNKLSLADFVLVPMLHYLERSPLAEEYVPEHSAVKRYVNHMRNRPSGSKVLQALEV